MADTAAPASGLLDLLTDAIAAAPARCSYAEARHVATDSESVLVRNGRVAQVDNDSASGIGVRVRVGGGWGFAATREETRAGVEGALARALAIAESQPTAPAGALAAVPPAARPLGLRLRHRPADGLARGQARAAVRRRGARCAATRASSAATPTARAGACARRSPPREGAACTQERVECGAAIAAIALDGDELQVRSYPSVARRLGGLRGLGARARLRPRRQRAARRRRGARAADRAAVPGRAQRRSSSTATSSRCRSTSRSATRSSSIACCSARPPTPARAGSRAHDLGSLRYGSEHLQITADATLPGGLGSFGWDDEGVAARRTPLIESGLLRAALSDRQSAAAIGLEHSGGCARADGFSRQPIVRMTNVSIEPGSAGSLADLIADTGEGLYLETNRSWSIDDRRLQFQFGTEVAREIRGGELGRLLRNASYAGVTPRFWGSLDAVCSPAEWRLRGLGNCGKGEPGQMMRVSHGAAPARFRDVEVGVA